MSLMRKSVIQDKISAGMYYDSLLYQIDDKSRINITGKAMQLQLDNSIITVNWITASKDSNSNDIVKTFSAAEFLEFAKAVGTYYESIILTTKD